MKPGRWGATLLVAGCFAGPDSSPDIAAPPLRAGYLAEPRWERGNSSFGLSVGTPGALAAGHGAAVLHLRDPCLRLTMTVSDPPEVMVSHPCDAPVRGHPLATMSHRSDAVFAGRRGEVLHLDGQRGMVVAENIGGDLTVRGRLPSRAPIHAACSSDGQYISYTDSLTPGVVRIHDLRVPDSSRELVLPPEFLAEGPSTWAGVQMGGAPGEPCVLVAPRAGLFAVIEGDSVVWTAALHEPLAMAPPRSQWERFLDRFRGPPPPPPVGPLDATSFAGGIAVLHQGATAEGGRLVDLYDRRGAYRETMILPKPAARIASTGTELLAMGHNGRQWWIALFWFPGEAPDPPPADTLAAARLPRH